MGKLVKPTFNRQWFPVHSKIPNKKLSPLKTSKTRIVDRAGRSVQLTCVNNGGFLARQPYLFGSHYVALITSPTEFDSHIVSLVGEQVGRQFIDEWETRFFNERDVAALSRDGFNCIRFPFRYKDVASETQTGQVKLNAAGVRHLDHVIDWATAHKVYVILNLHGAPGGENSLATVSDVQSTKTTPKLWTGGDSEKNKEKTIALWRLLADRYANDTTVAGYDLLNEPDLKKYAPASSLVSLYKRIIATVRQVDPKHMLFIEGDKLATDFSMFDQALDANMVYELHVYSLPAIGAPKSPWKDPSEKALRPYLQLSQSHQRPLWVGEFGENTLEWHRRVTKLLNMHRIGWAIWPWKRVGILIREQKHPVVREIQFPPGWKPIFDWLVNPWLSRKPNRVEAQKVLNQVLDVIELDNTRRDPALLKALFDQ